jgi:hypothetical protein
MNERINHCLWRWSCSLHRDPVVEHGGGAHLPGTLREGSRRKFWRREFLFVGARWGTWGVCQLGILETVGGLRKGSISLSGSTVRGAPLWGSGRRAQGTDITP